MSLASSGLGRDVLFQPGDGAAQGVLVALMSAFGADEAGQAGVGFCLVHQQRVVRRQGLGLAERQHGVADVPDLPGVQGGRHDVVDEAGWRVLREGALADAETSSPGLNLVTAAIGRDRPGNVESGNGALGGAQAGYQADQVRLAGHQVPGAPVGGLDAIRNLVVSDYRLVDLCAA